MLKSGIVQVDHYLGDIVRETGRVCFAGGVALNCVANGKLLRAALPPLVADHEIHLMQAAW